MADLSGFSYYLTFLDRDVLDAYAGYLTYRVQRDLFVLCEEAGQLGGTSWGDFVLEFRGSRRMRSAARIVMRRTLENFLDHGEYRFGKIPAELLCSDDEQDADRNILRFAQLYSPVQGRTIINVLLLHTEWAYYQYRRSQNAAYTWRQHMHQLSIDRVQWQIVRTAFRDALFRLDFTPVWCTEDLAEAAEREEALGD